MTKTKQNPKDIKNNLKSASKKLGVTKPAPKPGKGGKHQQTSPILGPGLHLDLHKGIHDGPSVERSSTEMMSLLGNLVNVPFDLWTQADFQTAVNAYAGVHNIHPVDGSFRDFHFAWTRLAETCAPIKAASGFISTEAHNAIQKQKAQLAQPICGPGPHLLLHPGVHDGPAVSRTSTEMVGLLGNLLTLPFDQWTPADFQTAVNAVAGVCMVNSVYDGIPQSAAHNGAVRAFNRRWVRLVETCAPLRKALQSTTTTTTDAYNATQKRKAQLKLSKASVSPILGPGPHLDLHPGIHDGPFVARTSTEMVNLLGNLVSLPFDQWTPADFQTAVNACAGDHVNHNYDGTAQATQHNAAAVGFHIRWARLAETCAPIKAALQSYVTTEAHNAVLKRKAQLALAKSSDAPILGPGPHLNLHPGVHDGPAVSRTTLQMMDRLGDLVYIPFDLWLPEDFQTAVNAYAGGSALERYHDGTWPSMNRNAAVISFNHRWERMAAQCVPIVKALQSSIPTDAYNAIQKRTAQIALVPPSDALVLGPGPHLVLYWGKCVALVATTTTDLVNLLGDLVYIPFDLWFPEDFQTALNVLVCFPALNHVLDGTAESVKHNVAAISFMRRWERLAGECAVIRAVV